jgi:hypothetical protein
MNRSSDSASDGKRWRYEHELVNAVFTTVLGQVTEQEDLAHGQPDLRYGHPVPGLNDAVCVIGTNLDAPGVRGDGSDFSSVQPRQRIDGEAPVTRKPSSKHGTPCTAATSSSTPRPTNR